ncbi:hypothetical protein HPB47_013636 [Ixodes persulcatus]|uniref:Uncharacterized protein n=1 Tax=Ixodes persulcatus TaxID=34615 RepID=A0AC60R3R8_IXOPE|nr:hypothetical protein HPB47_013636 [Ixodes persulcatus]
MKKLQRSQKQCSKLKKTIENLRGKVKALEAFESRKQLVELDDSHPAKQFILNQLKQLKRKRRGRRFTSYDKSVATALHYCSPTGYGFMETILGLPSERSIRAWLSSLAVKPGLNKSLLKILALKNANLPVQGRLVAVIIDEVSLKEHIIICAKGDYIEGYTTESGPELLANHSLAVMIKTLKKGEKQVLGYYLPHNAMPGDEMAQTLRQILKEIRESGFIPKVMVCDQGPNNLRMKRELGITEEKPFIEVLDEKVYFMNDTPHLLKNTRNNLKKYDFKHGTEIYKFRHIQDFYNLDKDCTPRAAPRFRAVHLALPTFTTMRICFAARTLSHSVSSGMLTYIETKDLTEDARDTAKFMEKWTLSSIRLIPQACIARKRSSEGFPTGPHIGNFGKKLRLS